MFRSHQRLEYYTVAIFDLASGERLAGCKYRELEAAKLAYGAACSDAIGTRVELGVKYSRAWLKILDTNISDFCPECGKSRPGDDRVASGMKCAFCAY